MVVGVKEEIVKLITTFKAIQAIFHNVEKKQVQDERMKIWLENLKDVVYEIEDDRLREKLESIAREKDNYGLVYSMEAWVSPPQLEPREKTSSLATILEVYGRDVDRDIINVMEHFGKTMSACVSEPFNKTRVIKGIIEATCMKVLDIIERNVLHCLLSDAIKDMMFMPALDDVWIEDYNQWSSFKLCLDGGAIGSRILITTHNERVMVMMNSTYTHPLGGLTEENSWLL
ncbi:hypothetical protein GIB67_016795 [Kingdonia uniflora]|uniref:Rx N-terminal domain-containing protein n=1 Tax=Kingdonia uniflora TaxID=39325 RepID=A0A7J7LS47_9MAGN|nr:hypothetical protein GIB67_016795 [Kingdonia uniflora]